MANHSITNTEKEYLRELAKKILEYSKLPIMEERKKAWYAHNALQGEKPMIVMEMLSFPNEMLLPLKCESEAAKLIEWQLKFHIINHELIDDDKVVPDYYCVDWMIEQDNMGIQMHANKATDDKGRDIAYVYDHPIKDLSKDLSILRPSKFKVDREETLALKTFVEETLGDILPVKLGNTSLQWPFMPSSKVVHLMGAEAMMFAMIDYPDEINQLYNFICEDILRYVKWQQDEGLLVLNNGNDYAGAGSYGFTTELPTEDYKKTGIITPKDLWINANSQETVCLSPSMYKEFIAPHYHRLAEEVGLLYYGCCEPVHDIWTDCVENYPNLRKVSISAWCNEDIMGEALKGSKVIYSRKPSPNFIGVGEKLDEAAFTQHIQKTLTAAKGCHLEIIFRDIYTLSGDKTKPGRAVKIVRDLIEKMW